jgi:segregation and condensation protein B
MLYRTTKDFLLRFGLNDLGELPSIEEFEKLAGGDTQADLFDHSGNADATALPDESQENSHDAVSSESSES